MALPIGGGTRLGSASVAANVAPAPASFAAPSESCTAAWHGEVDKLKAVPHQGNAARLLARCFCGFLTRCTFVFGLSDLYKSGFVFTEVNKNPAGPSPPFDVLRLGWCLMFGLIPLRAALFRYKKGRKENKELDNKPFILISLVALADSTEDTVSKYALPPLFYAWASGQKEAVKYLHTEACDEQPEAKSSQIYCVELDSKNKVCMLSLCCFCVI
jgi:hypothetical protein